MSGLVPGERAVGLSNLTLWLAGCLAAPALPTPADTAADTAVDTQGDTAGDTQRETGADPPDPQPTLSAAEVGAALEAAGAWGLPDPLEIAALYAGLLRQGDDACPGPTRMQGELAVFEAEGCVSQGGYRYQGAAGGSALSCWDDTGDGRVDICVGALRGDGAITDPAGARLVIGGYGDYILTGDPVDGGVVAGQLYGSWQYGGEASPWLQAGVSAALAWEGWIDRDGIHDPRLTGGYTVGIEGGAGGGQAVDLEIRYGAECGGAPAGRVGLRGEGGYWYDLIYDPATCDRCGEVVFNGGVPLGRGCADLGPAIFGMLAATQARTLEALEPGAGPGGEPGGEPGGGP